MYLKNGLKLAFALLSVSLMSGSSAFADSSVEQGTGKTITELTKDWPEQPRKMAVTLAEKYGMPTETTSKMLIWENTGLWKKIILHREEVPHNMPMPHRDFLEQVAAFRIHPSRMSDLTSFDGSVIARRTDGELIAYCDREENNIASLNVAYDVIQRTRTVEQARQFLAKTVKEIRAGQHPEYAQALRFPVQSITTARDPDVSVTQP